MLSAGLGGEGSPMAEILKKICLCGDPYVGKTSLIRRFVTGKYDDGYLATLGTVIAKKTMKAGNGDTMTLMVWDISGQKEFKRVHQSAFQYSRGGIAVCDVTRPQTAENLAGWLKSLREFTNEDIPVVVLINKIDLAGDDAEPLERILRIVEGYNCTVMTTSAKTGDNVDDAFATIVGMTTPGSKPGQRVSEIVESKLGADTQTDLLERMVFEFCQVYGDTESGMNVIRRQATEANIDIARPSNEDLARLSDRLVSLVEESKGSEAASALKSEFTRAKESSR